LVFEEKLDIWLDLRFHFPFACVPETGYTTLPVEENSRTVNRLAIRLLFNSAPGLQSSQFLALKEITDSA